MFPELVSVGPLNLRSLSVAVAFAFICISFLFWRKGREEHYELGELFDVFFLSWLVGFIGGRITYILLHQDLFGMNVGRWFDVIAFPGFSGLICVLIAALYLFWQAQKNEWDSFELIDFLSLAVTNGLIIMYIGQFFDGTGMGTPTTLPVGVMFPGTQEAHHPAQLYLAISFFFVSWILNRVEYRYRSFAWYRAGKKTAQTGFLTSVFLIASGISLFCVSFVRPAQYVVSGIGLDALFAGIAFCAGVWLLFVRSGRGLQKRKLAQYESV